MISRNQAETLDHGTLLTHIPTGRNWRVTGNCKTWIRSPERYRIPIKHGLYRHWEITEVNCSDFELRGGI